MTRWRVLIVDDEPEIREILGEFLRDLGHRADAVASGREAIEAVESASSPYDVALVDWQMYGITGREVLQALARLSPETAVIVSTGNTGLRIWAGADGPRRMGVLYKPFSLRDLQAEISRITEAAATEPTVP